MAWENILKDVSLKVLKLQLLGKVFNTLSVPANYPTENKTVGSKDADVVSK